MEQTPSRRLKQATAVMMVGGTGKRFWPKSRRERPKQCLRLMGKKTLIEMTFDRLRSLFRTENIFCILTVHQEEEIRTLLPQLPSKNLLLEPEGRNTAACLCLATLTIEARRGDVPIFASPADHLIADQQAFESTVRVACQVAQDHDYLITLGIEPKWPTAGYGYIEQGKILFTKPQPFYRVKQFIEKPPRDRACELIASGSFLWNSGMFFWRPSVLISAFQHHLPAVLQPLRSLQHRLTEERVDAIVEPIYSQLPATSIDYGIMEKATNVALLPAEFGWSDLGDWEALAAALPQNEDGNTFEGFVRGLDTKHCYIASSEKLIAVIGLENFIVVETDDIVLICPKSRSQDVKELVRKLEEEGAHRYL